VLDVLGLDDSEELAYRALVEVPSYDASELADRLSCHPVGQRFAQLQMSAREEVLGFVKAEIAVDRVWRDGLPLVLGANGADLVIEGSTDGLPELDARILGLLLAGLNDQAVANQLNLSMRTVQRRVRALMDLVSADTRLQLGFHAARKGWI
jgi:DNA-binding CsgD family transcriptional regulator